MLIHQPTASFPRAEVGFQSIFVITFVERKDKNVHKKIIKYNHDYETGWSGGEVTFQAILWRKCHPEEWAYESFHHGAASSWAVSHPTEKELSQELNGAPPHVSGAGPD